MSSRRSSAGASATPWASKLMSFVEGWEAVNARTFRMTLKEPYGLVLESFGKPGANVPFIMPKRVAATPADKQIDDTPAPARSSSRRTNGGQARRWCTSGTRNTCPAPNPPAEPRAGRSVKVDRVEWIVIKDRANAGQRAGRGRGRPDRDAGVRAISGPGEQSGHPDGRAQSARRSVQPALQSSGAALQQPEGAGRRRWPH